MSARRYTPEQEVEIVARFHNHESLRSMLKIYGGCYPSIRGVLRRHGVYEKRVGNHIRTEKPRDLPRIEEMERLWNEGLSLSAIGRELGAKYSTVGRELRRKGIMTETRLGTRCGEEHGQWKGGRSITTEGYTSVRLHPDDPLAPSMRLTHGYVLEHRLVMARHLGRPLDPHETVHHINGDKTDNRLENLQLRWGRHGNGVVLTCRECGSNNIAENEC